MFSVKNKDGFAVVEFKESTITGTENAELNTIVHNLIETKQHQRVVFDMKAVEYTNSSGLGLLAASLSSVKAAGGMLFLINVTERVKGLLEITKLNKVIPCYEKFADIPK